MQSRYGPILFALSLTVLSACSSGDDPAGPGADTTAPAAVTDLHVMSFDETSATVIWTAPGDDGSSGTAAEYQIGFAAEPITPASWLTCTMLPSCPTPTPGGSQQDAQIETPPVPDVYVALKTRDDSGNWSGLSNVAHGHIATTYEVRQLTFEGSNTNPCLSDGFVTWVGTRVADADEIWIANVNVASPTPDVLTDNGGEKWHPSSHGREKIVWMGRAGGGDDWEIFSYSVASVPRYSAFTDNDVEDWFPMLAGAGDFVWQHGFTMFAEIHYWNGGTHNEIVLSDVCCPTSEYTNERPVADDHTVVWRTSNRVESGEFRIYMWNGILRDITDDITIAAHDYSLDGGTLAYEWSAQPATIRYWDGATVHMIGNGADPSLDDGWIAFERWDGHDWEIYLWDGTSIEQITNNDFEDFDPSLSGDRLAWVGRPTGPGGLHQVFYTRVPKR